MKKLTENQKKQIKNAVKEAYNYRGGFHNFEILIDKDNDIFTRELVGQDFVCNVSTLYRCNGLDRDDKTTIAQCVLYAINMID